MGVVKTGTPVPGLGFDFGDIDISQLFFYTFAKASTTSLRLYDDSRNYTEFKGTNFGYSVDAFGNFDAIISGTVTQVKIAVDAPIPGAGFPNG
jgi:hypothetical protein